MMINDGHDKNMKKKRNLVHHCTTWHLYTWFATDPFFVNSTDCFLLLFGFLNGVEILMNVEHLRFLHNNTSQSNDNKHTMTTRYIRCPYRQDWRHSSNWLVLPWIWALVLQQSWLEQWSFLFLIAVPLPLSLPLSLLPSSSFSSILTLFTGCSFTRVFIKARHQKCFRVDCCALVVRNKLQRNNNTIINVFYHLILEVMEDVAQPIVDTIIKKSLISKKHK